jgi:hypothetical protein
MSGGGLVSASDLIFSPLRENANAKPKNASTINAYKNQTMTRAYCLLVGAQISFPIATAVSIMRLEKPHSLSYHDSTATIVPSITFVWSMWKIDERAS